MTSRCRASAHLSAALVKGGQSTAVFRLGAPSTPPRRKPWGRMLGYPRVSERPGAEQAFPPTPVRRRGGPMGWQHRGKGTPGRRFSRAASRKSPGSGVGSSGAVRWRPGVLQSSGLVSLSWSLLSQGQSLSMCVRRETTDRGFQVAWHSVPCARQLLPIQMPGTKGLPLGGISEKAEG